MGIGWIGSKMNLKSQWKWSKSQCWPESQQNGPGPNLVKKVQKSWT